MLYPVSQAANDLAVIIPGVSATRVFLCRLFHYPEPNRWHEILFPPVALQTALQLVFRGIHPAPG